MIIILGVFLGVMTIAVATTVFAIVRARDGYEDDAGFHSAGPSVESEVAPRTTMMEGTPAQTPARSGTAAQAGAAAGLPAGLLGAR